MLSKATSTTHVAVFAAAVKKAGAGDEASVLWHVGNRLRNAASLDDLTPEDQRVLFQHRAVGELVQRGSKPPCAQSRRTESSAVAMQPLSPEARLDRFCTRLW